MRQHLLGGFAHHIAPQVQCQRGAQANANHALPLLAHARLHELQAFLNFGQHIGRGRVGIEVLPLVAHRAQKIGDDHFQAAPPNLQTHAVCAIGIQSQGHRRLAHFAANAFLLEHQAVVNQPRDDGGHGLRGELGESRQIGLGHGAVVADGTQHRAFVELPHAHMVGAAHFSQVFAGAVFRCHERSITPLQNKALP